MSLRQFKLIIFRPIVIWQELQAGQLQKLAVSQTQGLSFLDQR